ncbi:MAG: isocitrate lyase/phosphoenolpyruvate mutase family protein, partial [Steroidobacteraceae bacterium]
MSASLLERAERFRALHQAAGIFVIANAWDGASARILEGLGFEAIATSSGAAAATYGRLDHQLTREEALEHSRLIVASTRCPVSA